jgi:hypothetical protein
VGREDRGSDLKGAGYGSFNRNSPYGVFLAADDLVLAPPDIAAPLAAAALLAFSVELRPLGWLCSTS